MGRVGSSLDRLTKLLSLSLELIVGFAYLSLSGPMTVEVRIKVARRGGSENNVSWVVGSSPKISVSKWLDFLDTNEFSF